MPNKITALVVEDYKMIADAWGKLLENMKLFSEVRVIYTPENLTEIIKELKPSLIFMDINLPGPLTGLELTSELTRDFLGIKIAILSIHNEPAMVKRAMTNGAMAYLTKNSSIKEMETAVQKVLAGDKYLCEEVRHYKI